VYRVVGAWAEAARARGFAVAADGGSATVLAAGLRRVEMFAGISDAAAADLARLFASR
jgi:hypothetical protein